ncbi:polymer-forming cytoskeletal protein [Anoxybacteroides rupiense]|uniref:polymer-forming cytoskeletal protein n=1 Tax=Anoxybacteroides rupiense TaxID=311460 RepID=UPI001F090AA7|nr:polymer-forming cytoskeletal protein [Anoxybacillus rupiensis]
MRNLTVNGSALTSGGTFRNVTIRGDATISGDVQCAKWKVFGNADVSGNMTAEWLNIFGQANIRGNVHVKTIKLFGQADIRGNTNVDDMRLRGAAHIQGNITGGAIHGYGEMNVSGDCETESFSVKGVVQIANTLNAERVDLSLYFADSRISEIGGKTIRVKRSKWNVMDLFKGMANTSARLMTEIVEGDEIYLEHTSAQIVRGDRIIIGPGCDIELIEYQTSLQQSERAVVKEKRKI